MNRIIEIKEKTNWRHQIAQNLNIFFPWLVKTAQKKYGLILFVCALLLIGSVYRISLIKMELDLYDILDPSLKSSQNQWTMRSEFVDVNSVFMTLYSDAEITNHQVCKLKTFLKSYYNGTNELERVLSPWSVRTPKLVGEKIWYPTLLEDPCVGEPGVGINKEWSKFDNSPWQFFFKGRTKNQISLDIVFHDMEGENGVKKFDILAIDHFVRGMDSFILKELPSFKYHVFGHVSFRWHILQILKKDFVWNVVVLFFFGLFFYFFLGTWRAGIYFGVTLIFSEILLFGTMSLIGFPIDLMSNCLFLMTAVAGVSDFLFISSAQKSSNFQRKELKAGVAQADPRENWSSSFLEVATPSFFTSLTTVCGFLSLGFSTIPAISRFGLAAAIGAGYQWASTFLLLPALLKAFKAEKGWIGEKRFLQIKAKWFLGMNNLNLGRIFTSLLVLSGIFGLAGSLRLNIGDDILKNFPETHSLRKAYSWLREDKGWQGQVFLLFRPGVEPNKIESLLSSIAKNSKIRHIEDPLEMEDFLTQGLSFVDRSLVLREMSLGPLKRYRSINNYVRVPLYTDSLDLEVLRGLVKEIENLCEKNCFLAGQTIVYLEYSDRISQTLVDSLFSSTATVVVILLLLAWIQGVGAYISIVLSALWAPMVMMGVLWWTQIPVTSVTSIFFALIVGWTGDNAIQYLFASKNVLEGADKRASATLMQTLLFCGCSAFFMFHTFVPMNILGFLFLIGFIVTYIGDLWVLRGLLLFRQR